MDTRCGFLAGNNAPQSMVIRRTRLNGIIWRGHCGANEPFIGTQFPLNRQTNRSYRALSLSPSSVYFLLQLVERITERGPVSTTNIGEGNANFENRKNARY